MFWKSLMLGSLIILIGAGCDSSIPVSQAESVQETVVSSPPQVEKTNSTTTPEPIAPVVLAVQPSVSQDKETAPLKAQIASLEKQNKDLKEQLAKPVTPTTQEKIVEKVVYQPVQCDNSALTAKINELQGINSKWESHYQTSINTMESLKATNTSLQNKVDYLTADSAKANELLNKSMNQLREFSDAVIRYQKLVEQWKSMYYTAIGQPEPN